ncbi:type VII secretion integral membrane protein EccD [Mycolicibacterium brumae]|uniref:Type VII secretion integral membrane protein EccD n=1 Tax=Mycolicibacterium brumae TaxID=85968 RepID=A0A2G5PBH6_9MYCO|nr:type VII secretion integral membrane protein EccD [Mycolicibacterium brumae]MCV7192917.1 type VII secretion integral membrane protein EccD [Mycolicibacterium brumae]PIB75244.1 type VII secretion integral membrane protein EccD [Mycolicibacterium brumae]RWA23506.1 hypothetical protein MBRU_01395 [Mycolicibacterium brumae DSM 44177]UWW08564.1 type VII secretion integral membrane protein EccD2 [Mycolicibacterium brumae]
MTATDVASADPPAVSFPARCLVAVICGDQLVSQVYPASVPVEAFLDDIVELLDEELKRRGRAGLDTGIGYELLRANGTRLDIGRTLDELGVEDGATLVFGPAAEGEGFEPQCESLSTGLAQVGRRLFPPMTPRTVAHTAMAVLAAVCATLLAGSLRTRLADDGAAAAVVTGTAGLLATGAAAAVWRWWPRRDDLLCGFGWLAAPQLAAACAAAAPGDLGAPHAFVAAVAAAVAVVALTRVTGREMPVAAAVVTLCALAGALAAARMWRPVPAQWLAMCALLALLVLLTIAPNIALRAARIRPPHFGSITGRDLFHRADGMPVDAVAPVDPDGAAGDDGADPTPRGDQVAAAAVRANGLLTGLCAAAGVALPPAVWVTLDPGAPKATGAAVLAGLMALIFLIRSRNFADRRQSVALILGGCVAVCAGVTRYLLGAPAGDGSALLLAAAVLLGFGSLTLVAALLVPPTRFTPLVRMCAEWLELLAIIAVLPLAAWVGGLFTWVRMR